MTLNIAFREKKHECGHPRAFDGPGGELAHGKIMDDNRRFDKRRFDNGRRVNWMSVLT